MKNNYFSDFMECRQSAKMLVNPFYLEYLLNLFYQGYFGEIWEEITDTKINAINSIERISYGIIGDNL